MNVFLISLALLLYSCTTTEEVSNASSIELSGSWQFRQVGNTDWLAAKVPGSVQADLLATGDLPDPHYGNNERLVQWVENHNWEYYKTFEVASDFLNYDYIELELDGLDTYAEVRLNDSLLLRTNNMFRFWQIDVKKHLRQGQNSIHVLFRSPVNVHRNTADSLGYALPAGNDAADLKVSPYVRKAPYQFGWDWSPRLVTMGIWKSLRLKANNLLKVRDVYYEQQKVDTENADIVVHLEALVLDAKAYRLKIRQGANVLAIKNINPPKGVYADTVQFSIKKPKLWWSNGLGKPHRYGWTAELFDGEQLVHSSHHKIGLRSIELVREKDAVGTSFYFKLNGQPVFMKGANYIPQDNLLSRVEYYKYEQIIQDAVASNMNMLRVWGGGIYENEVFYDLCDEHGILVWQDFMFACSMYPADDRFNKNIEQEVLQNVKRLRNHACVALWCGNNEIEVAWKNWGWPKQMGYSAAQIRLLNNNYNYVFDTLIRQTVAQLNTQRAYVSTSPLSNWGKAQNFNHHSMHYWGVWHGRESFEQYPRNVGRFMSEYGFQSFPCMHSIHQFADSSQFFLNSEVMKHHQKSYIGNGLIQKHIAQYFPKPQNFAQLVYLSQLSQAKGIEMAIKAHRRSKKCMGSLYWQLNDCWPGPSWSGIDYFGRWKAMQYSVRDLYKDVLIVVDSAGVNRLALSIISDRMQDANGMLKVELISLDGVLLASDTATIQLKANQRTPLRMQWNNYTGSEPLNNLFYKISYTDSMGEYRQLRYFVPEKELNLKKLNIVTDFDETAGGYALTISCPVLLKNVYISAKSKVQFSDNYFDLLPNETKRITLKTSEKISWKDLEFFCMNQINSF